MEAAVRLRDRAGEPDPVPDKRVRFQIQGLDPAKKYNLTFFGSHKFSNDATTTVIRFTPTTPIRRWSTSTSLDAPGPS